MSETPLNFRISSGLKDLIGSGLITDNYVAIFELVKNSFDAGATKVDISFLNIHDGKGPARIIIQDDGKGMTYNDLINKWLFVAYSAKKDNTEDIDENTKQDYRYQANSLAKRYAGAKGVGRFSCDKLGKKLVLKTISKFNQQEANQLTVDWRMFENVQSKEFGEIGIEHSVLVSTPKGFQHGTILEISDVDSSEWDRSKYIQLKRQLAKLIRPDFNGAYKANSFKICLHIPEEEEKDALSVEQNRGKENAERAIYNATVNGDVENFIFDDLNIKTTKITSKIDEDGATVVTSLYDRGSMIYEIKEKNEYSLLSNVSITLYFLNQSAKSSFKRQVGTETVNFGSIFVYKNGFRIYPYGERGDDSLGIDNRAVQGYSRYIGLRNLIGIVDIRGDIDLQETTSRNGGLIKSKTFYQLAQINDTNGKVASSFLLNTLRRLEKYAVEVAQWGVNRDDFNLANDKKSVERFIKFIANQIGKNNIDSITPGPDIEKLLKKAEENSVQELVGKFRSLAAKSKDKASLRDAERLEKVLTRLSSAKDSAEQESHELREKNQIIQKELTSTIGQNLFLKSDMAMDKSILITLQHNINHSSNRVNFLLKKAIELLEYNNDKLNEALSCISNAALENQKIFTISRCVSKVNFDAKVEKISGDIVDFINEYLINIYSTKKTVRYNLPRVKINIANPISRKKIIFNPIEIIMVIDNLINNSIKADANIIDIHWRNISNSNIELSIHDDGAGIPAEISKRIFDYRFSTTDGAGLGLYYVKDILQKIGASITVDLSVKKGAKFSILFKI